MRAGERGYTLVAALVMVAVCALGMAAVGPLWSQQVQREHEQELLRIGALYAQAIADYRDASPGNVKQLPQKLQDLLLDTRFIGVRRYLRRLYEDPINPGQPWGLVLDSNQGIVGVYSLSNGVPLATGVMAVGQLSLPPAAHYSDWKFTIESKS